MDALAREVLSEMEETIHEHNTQVTVKPLGTVLGDHAMLRQVMVNLLSNAVKYSSKNSSPKVEVSASQQKGFRVFQVKDNGVGFDMKQTERLFTVFHRLGTAEGFEGSGIGLAIVQNIINRHGGRVWAEAEPGKGATFFFSLPEER
jgi:light-regulated signal transduction histidine kinase (bacteriophytochrome)